MAKKVEAVEAVEAVVVEKAMVTTEDIVRAIAAREDIDLPQKDVKAVIKAFEEEVANGIANGKKVQVTGFFSAKPAYRGARTANNVHTGEPMEVPESMGVSITAGKRIKDATIALTPSDFKKEVK